MSAVALDTAIAALSVPGLTIKGLSAIPQEVNLRECPILFPDTNGWLGQSESTPGNFDNVIAGRLQYEHNLNYVMCYAPVGSGRGLIDHYLGMSNLTELLVSKISRIDQNATSIRSVKVSKFGQEYDMAGKAFYGCGITVTALEYIP